MEHPEYFRDKVKTFLTCLPERTLNTGIDVVITLIVYDTAYPCTPQGSQHALASWPLGRHGTWQCRISGCKSNPTGENLAIIAKCAINEHAPHTQSGFDDLVEYACRSAIDETLIENELKRRSNDNGER